MARQYKRKYTFTVTADGESRTITGLRVEFNVTKSLRSFPNLAKITLYNLSDETQAALESKFATVTLNAGYEGYEKLLFKGEIRNTTLLKQGVDSKVTVYAGDGQRDWESSFVNLTFDKKVKINAVIEKVARTMTYTSVEKVDGIANYSDKLRGQTLSGSTKDVLDSLAKNYDFQWSIQDGVFQAIPNNEIKDIDLAVKINQETGMIGSPTITDQGVEVKTLLNPAIKPDGAIIIESTSANISKGNLFFREVKETRAIGQYKVYEITHTGDTHSDEWSSNILGIPI